MELHKGLELDPSFQHFNIFMSPLMELSYTKLSS